MAWPVIKEAFAAIAKGNIFTEFLLMTLATIGALALGEYPEAVAVMLFYSIGELFQDAAVNKAKIILNLCWMYAQIPQWFIEMGNTKQ